MTLPEYGDFIRAKARVAEQQGFAVDPSEINPLLKPHIQAVVPWMLMGGRRALFARFGMQKTTAHLECMRLVTKRFPGRPTLIAMPLGARLSFFRDAKAYFQGEYAIRLKFIRSNDEIDPDAINLTNFESIREGKVDPGRFVAASLDEGDILRSFGGTKTFREFMRLFEPVQYRFVATATPDPNEYVELLAYAAFLGVMDVGEAKTRFFKRNSEKADKLTIHPHKEREFWLWVASWALFLQKPSDLGPQFSDEGYDLPPLDIRWHEIPTDHSTATASRDGNGALFKDAATNLSDAAREKRESLPARIAKVMEIRAEQPEAHRILWHDLEDERRALEKAIPGLATVYGSQDIEAREALLMDFAEGRIPELGGKPMQIGAGGNYQAYCWWAVFAGIGFKFKDIIQAIHRIQRYGQRFHRFHADGTDSRAPAVRLDFIYTEAEREIRRSFEAKWQRYDAQAEHMSGLIREYGLAHQDIASAMQRSIGVERVEARGEAWVAVNNDCVEETAIMPENSVGLIVSSIPFATQYEYTPSYNDFGHTDDNAHFFRQMDFLTPQLLRVLQPGRIAAIHVKDRIVPGGMTRLGFQTVEPFHAQTIEHFRRHGFAYLGMKTVVTDVVRENNQTYRLGWTEQCKDGSRMGCGMPEYVLLFRKPPTDSSNGYADEPVVKDKPLCDDHGEPAPFDQKRNWKQPVPGTGYSRALWQLDAHGFMRSGGDRLLSSAELLALPHDQLYKLWRDRSQQQVYDFGGHLSVTEEMDRAGRLPSTFMLLPPHSWHPDVWTDVTRMRTLNGAQHAAGREMHLCLARGTLVLTRDGYKPIEAVRVGDQVLTHRGRWRRVTAARMTGIDQPVVQLQAHGVPALKLTPDHKLWTRPVRGIQWARAHSKLEASRAEPRWIEARDTVGSYVNLKLPPIEEPKQDDLTLWWVVGRWLGDGHFDARGGAVISCSAKEASGLQEALGRFGGNPAHGQGSARQILLRDKSKALRTILSRCGRGAAGKQLPPEAYTLPPAQARALLDGYLSADGHFEQSRQRWMATSVSRPLLLGIAMLAQRVHGAIASVYAGREGGRSTIQGRPVNTRPEWVLSFDMPVSGRPKGSPFIAGDGAWKKVRAAEQAGTAETWCLRVEEDESFTAEGCIVKNCPLQFDIVDRLIVQMSMKGEVVLDPFGGLMTVPLRAVLLGRRGHGIELNQGYYRDGVEYLRRAEANLATPTLFDLIREEAAE